MGKNVPEPRVAQKPCQQVVVPILQYLAVHRRVLAALDEDQRGMPVDEILDHPGMLKAIELGEPLRRWATRYEGSRAVSKDCSPAVPRGDGS